LRKDALTHQNVCQFAVVACAFAPYGCKVSDLTRQDYSVHLNANATAHAELLANKLASRVQRKVRWQVKWPLEAGVLQVQSQDFSFGEYSACLDLDVYNVDEDGYIGIFISVTATEKDYLFPANLVGSTIRLVHPTDTKLTVVSRFIVTAEINENGDGRGCGNLVSLDRVLDFVADGKLTVEATIQIEPPECITLCDASAANEE
jgi:hypothetical protein